RTQKKRFSFSRSLAYSICWDRLLLPFTASFFTSSQFHKRFNLFIIRTTASLIETEGGDSSKIQTDFLRAMECCRSSPCPAGIANGLRWDERQCSPMSLEPPECVIAMEG